MATSSSTGLLDSDFGSESTIVSSLGLDLVSKFCVAGFVDSDLVSKFALGWDNGY